MNTRIWWNDGWKFTDNYSDELLKNEPCEGLIDVRLPHTTKETPYNYFSEDIYQKNSGYRRIFTPDSSWKGKNIIFTIEAAGHSAEVYLNGEKIKEHKCGYTAFSMNLAPHINWEGKNVLVVKVDSNEKQNRKKKITKSRQNRIPSTN